MIWTSYYFIQQHILHDYYFSRWYRLYICMYIHICIYLYIYMDPVNSEIDGNRYILFVIV